jgi:hypothetical protein
VLGWLEIPLTISVILGAFTRPVVAQKGCRLDVAVWTNDRLGGNPASQRNLRPQIALDDVDLG